MGNVSTALLISTSPLRRRCRWHRPGLDLAAVDDTFGAGTVGTCDNITRNTSALTISGSGENKRRSRCSTMSTTTAFGWRRGDAGYGDGAGNLPASCEGVRDRFGWRREHGSANLDITDTTGLALAATSETFGPDSSGKLNLNGTGQAGSIV